MAIHSTPASMLKESLDETLEAAKICVNYKKIDSKWGQFSSEGCLGYPAGVLLFSIIDTIGSYYRKSQTLKVLIDGKQQTINADGWEHFKILNSKYFNQTLSTSFLKSLYNKFRSSLTHNSVLGKDSLMILDNNSIRSMTGRNQEFALVKDNAGNDVHLIFMKELCNLCEIAVTEFKKDIDAIVPSSKQGKNFH